jgi:hypothetical protein
MSEEQNIWNELEELNSSLTTISKRSVFSVPDGYFDAFPVLLLERIRTSSQSFVATGTETGDDPDVDQELQAVSPLLAGLRGKNPLAVPEGYFETGSLPVLKPLIQAEEPPSPQLTGDISPVKGHQAKVISMDRGGQRKNFLYAAASIVVLLGLLTLFYMLTTEQGKSTTPVNITAELPKLPESELKDFLLGEDELVLEPVSSPSLAGLEEIDLEGLIKDVNEDELQQFISENPNPLPEKMN